MRNRTYFWIQAPILTSLTIWLGFIIYDIYTNEHYIWAAIPIALLAFMLVFGFFFWREWWRHDNYDWFTDESPLSLFRKENDEQTRGQ